MRDVSFVLYEETNLVVQRDTYTYTHTHTCTNTSDRTKKYNVGYVFSVDANYRCKFPIKPIPPHHTNNERNDTSDCLPFLCISIIFTTMLSPCRNAQKTIQ